ncbi:transglutaminase-like domain-containing protein [Paraburkholderia sp. BCC1884]|uniref:transglutaminase-like domain-containing protein n=1 Tax=Paraburkholderia sp. BCC1884 TaxID=2562668 RepID=UPI0011838648|nr:transglutaminase family protein [Paraburkholderia sp. BCC1884]
MRLRVGYELVFACPQATPMLLMLNTHLSRAQDMLVPDNVNTYPWTPLRQYRDSFGNLCTRLVAPPGELTLSACGVFEVPPHHELPGSNGYQHAIEQLPDESLMFLLGSRYCETDLLSDFAWRTFDHTPPGRDRVQAICDFVHRHVRFDYNCARPTRTAWQTWQDGVGVCRDYAHLAVALCRAMNIPARYCTGYISDVGLPPPYAPMDFCAWFEAFLGDHWETFDPRNNAPRTGRILMARGRDAADVAISNTFGSSLLTRFLVVCEPDS